MRVVGALGLLLLLPFPSWAQPDLTSEIYGVEIDTDQSIGSGDFAESCASAMSGLTLLRFGVRTHNVGDQAEIIGDPGCPDCALFPSASCANPDFQCSPANGHMHPHFIDFARYELLDMHGNVVAVGAKRGFCLRDDGPVGQPGCSTFDCTYQGISAGCFDDYHPTLGCQYIDVTSVPNVETRAFRLRVTTDPLQLLEDGDRSNNVSEVVLPGCGDGVLQSGEACDPGLPGGGVCCDADCHVVPGCDLGCTGRVAGAICRPATGPCDVPEVCDGVSDFCPPDASLPDATVCGAGTPPCVNEVCRGGTCVAERSLGACLIGASCFPANATDPANACQYCDPGRSASVWSPNRDPSPSGISCELARVTRAVDGIGCPARITRLVTMRLERAAGLADRLAQVRPAAASRLERRLLRLARRVSRLLDEGRNRGCAPGAALAELEAFMSQLEAMKRNQP